MAVKFDPFLVGEIGPKVFEIFFTPSSNPALILWLIFNSKKL